MFIQGTAEKMASVIKKSEHSLLNVKNFYVIFDKEYTPYLAYVMNFSQKQTNDRILYELRVYRIDEKTKKIDLMSYDAHVFYEKTYLPINADSFINNITVNKNFARLGIGSEMLRVVELNNYNDNITSIYGNILGFDYMSKKDDLLKNFYIKNKFNVNIKKFVSHNPFSKNDDVYYRRQFEKDLTFEEIDELKKRTINYPVLDKNLFIILPKTLIQNSDYIKEKTL